MTRVKLATVIAPLLVALSIAAPRLFLPVASAAPGQLSGNIPATGGFGIAVWGGGSTSQLGAAAARRRPRPAATAKATTSPGRTRATAAVTQAISATAATIPAATAVTRAMSRRSR